MKLQLWDRKFINRYNQWMNIYLVPIEFEHESISFDEAYTTYIGFEFCNREVQYRYYDLESNYKLIATNERFVDDIELEQDINKRIGIIQYVYCYSWRIGVQCNSYNFKPPYYYIQEHNDSASQLPLFTHYENNRPFIYEDSLFKFNTYTIDLKDYGMITEEEINEKRKEYLVWSLSEEVKRLQKYKEYSNLFLRITNDRLSNTKPGYNYY